jgi:hypothetical protein
VGNLPPESATKTALRNATPVHEIRQAVADADYGPWSQTEMLLAAILDVQNRLFWAKTEDGAKGQNPPEPFPRPGVPRKADKGRLSPDVIDLMEYMRTHNGAVPEGYGVG